MNISSAVSGMTCRPSSHSGNAPASIASARSRRWKSGSKPAASCASSQTMLCTPATGFQWSLTNEVSPAAFSMRKVWTPNPSVVRYDAASPRGDMTQIVVCCASVCRDTKSQNVSCALCACGISRSGSGLTA